MSEQKPQTDEKHIVLAWLFSRDTGVSSKSLAAEFLGVEYADRYPPRDPSDLGRCLRLIALAPSVRACVDSLATKNEEWAKAAIVWDSISAAMEEEVGIDWCKGSEATFTYKRMKRAGL